MGYNVSLKLCSSPKKLLSGDPKNPKHLVLALSSLVFLLKYTTLNLNPDVCTWHVCQSPEFFSVLVVAARHVAHSMLAEHAHLCAEQKVNTSVPITDLPCLYTLFSV